MNDELDKPATEHGVRASSNDVDVMWRFRVESSRLSQGPLINQFQPLVLEATAMDSLPEYSLDVVGSVVRSKDLDGFLDGAQRERQRGGVDEVLPVAA